MAYPQYEKQGYPACIFYNFYGLFADILNMSVDQILSSLGWSTSIQQKKFTDPQIQTTKAFVPIWNLCHF